MLGISTCWWHERVERGDEIIRGILDLGLKGVELEYRITGSMYNQMKPQLKKSLQVLTVHNFFPKPDEFSRGSGDLFPLCSTDPNERSKAVKYSIRTIEHAYDLGGKVVILHLGRVDMPDSSMEVRGISGEPGKEESEHLERIDRQKKLRRARHQKYLDAVLASLEELNKVAEKRNILLGVENRYHFYEIPDLEETAIILKRFKGGHIRYWHDSGHAAVEENAGFVRQKDLLEACSEAMVGVHLHDAKGLDDHWAPGQGEINFTEIKSHLRPSHLKILEVHPKVAKEDLIKGIQYLQTLGIE